MIAHAPEGVHEPHISAHWLGLELGLGLPSGVRVRVKVGLANLPFGLRARTGGARGTASWVRVRVRFTFRDRVRTG